MAKVVSVSKKESHSLSKDAEKLIVLVKDEGVLGDVHSGKTVKHRSRVKVNPSQPNLRQVHLMQNELLRELTEKGFQVEPGTLGENITTENLDLLSLPQDTLLRFPSGAEIVITGLRNPCNQLDDYQQGLTAAVLERDAQGNLIRKAGVMAIVKTGGEVKQMDEITIVLPPEPHRQLEKV